MYQNLTFTQKQASREGCHCRAVTQIGAHTSGVCSLITAASPGVQQIDLSSSSANGYAHKTRKGYGKNGNMEGRKRRCSSNRDWKTSYLWQTGCKPEPHVSDMFSFIVQFGQM